MSISRSLSTLALTCAGCVPLVFALLPNRLNGEAASRRPAPCVPQSGRQVADDWDAIIQPRFQDDRAGVFGMGRVVPIVKGHPEVNAFQPTSEAEKHRSQLAANSGRSFQVDFMHCAHVPGTYKGERSDESFLLDSRIPAVVPRSYLSVMMSSSTKPVPNWNDPEVRLRESKANQAQYDLLLHTATSALPRLLKGEDQEKAVSGWLVVMRPIRASNDSCLTCHVGAKHNDTLGVMVYAVSDTVARTFPEALHAYTASNP